MNQSADASSMQNNNPLLDIDISFSSYINARTRSFKSHVINGALDYAFDADFSMRQKIHGISGWNKLYKTIVSNDIPVKVKKLFHSSSIAGSLKFPVIYEATCKCAERLEISLPAVYVKNGDTREIYSIAGEGFDPCIVVTSDLEELCTPEELQLLIGCECGRIQNNHCVYNMTAPYIGLKREEGFIPPESPQGEGTSRQLEFTIAEWVRLADITSDRAGIICCDNPEKFPQLFASLKRKGIKDFFGRKGSDVNLEKLMKSYEVIHVTPARNIVIDPTATLSMRRIYAGMEFLNCDILYNWRSDLKKTDIHTVNKQALEVRCEIIVGAAKGEA